MQERLDLGGNLIRKITGLSTLVNLQVVCISTPILQNLSPSSLSFWSQKLWLAENDIKAISGIQTLSKLTDLNLAG